ncbi:MAG: acyl-homoserine-lactone synthase [Methylococcales bacterium]
MDNLIIGNENNKLMSENMLKSMYQLRFNVFYNELNWDVKTQINEEKDEFDTLDGSYIVYANGDNVIGCWRALPTLGKYMFQDVFPILARGEDIPKSRKILEISRFAVSKNNRIKSFKESRSSNVTRKLLDAALEIAEINNIDAFVTVVSTKMERLLIKSGFNINRFGDGESTMIGEVDTVACWIYMDEFSKKKYREINAINHFKKKDRVTYKFDMILS